MGESQDGSPPAAQRAQAEADPASPGKSRFLSRLFGWDSHEDTTESDAGAAADEGPRANGAARAETMVDLQKLAGLRVEDIAVPRADIVAVPVDADAEAVIRVFRESENTRLPVYEETLDRPVGLVHLKDFALRHVLAANGAAARPFDLRPLVRPLLYVPHSMPIGVLLRKMQALRSHMALVIDEYGGVDGLLTIEDILEQIIGEIGDEHDAEEGRLWTREADGIYLLNARLDLDEFAAETGVILDIEAFGDEVDTMGGLVAQIVGRLPEPGEVIVHPAGHEFEVLDADARRIKRLRLRLHRHSGTADRAAAE
jgi:magnesium and cobalt transporter